MPAPAVVRSRGPNGTHWFSKTPWKGDIGKGIIPNEIEVDCSFEALEAAVDAFLAEGASMGVPAAKVKAGTAFLIKPGVLQGSKTSPFAGGAAIIPRSILSGKGSAAWDGKALIWPRDGADSVRVSGQIAFDGTKGFVFAGMSTFDSNNTRRYARDGVEMNNVENFGWGWCESAAPRVSANAGKAVRNVELKEFGYADKISREGDYGGLGVNSTGTVQNLLLEGFDIPAVYHLILVPWKGDAPSDAHSDGWQLFGGQNVTGVVFRDGRAFAATEAAFQNAGYPGLRFDNVEAIGSPTSVRVFPYENNEATDGNVKAFSGSATVVAVNCDLTGSVTKTQFQQGTTGTRISYPWTGATRGLVTVDQTLQDRTPAQVYATIPRFTAERRAAIFGASSAPVDTTKPTAVVLGVPVVSGQDVQLSWSAATDAGTGVARYIVKRDGIEVTTSAPIVGTTWTDVGRPRGTNPTYTVQAIDGAGNTADISNARTASIALNGADTVKPAGSIISPDGTVPISGQAIVQVNATDNVGVAGVTLWSGPQKLPGTFVLDEGTVWEGRFDSTKFPDGSYPVEPHIVDAAGNEFVGATVVITIRNRVVEEEDKDAPTPPVLTIRATGLHTAEATWTRSEDASGSLVRYQLELDGDAIENDITDLARTLSALESKPVHTARVIAYDQANNLAASSPVTFNTWAFDTTGPRITLGTPATGVLTSNPQPFRFTAADADTDVQSAEVYVNDLLADAAERIDGDVWGTTLSFGQLPPGASTYKVKATDVAGNVSWSAAVAITVPAPTGPDITPPAGGITDPPEGTVVMPPFSRVIFSASDPDSGIGLVSLRSSTLGELAKAKSAAAGIYEADLPVARLPYGASKVFGRIVNGAGLITDTPPVTVIRLGKPQLDVANVTSTTATLTGRAPEATAGIVGYELLRGDTVLQRSDSIAAFAAVELTGLVADAEYVYTFVALGAGGTRSELATVDFRTSAKPIDIVPSWFPTGPRPAEGSAGPVNGRVLVRYSSDVRTLDGRELTPTQQVVNAVDGHFQDPSTGELWRGYRSEKPGDFIDWIEQFIGPDGRYLPDRHRRFRFPPTATGPMVAYLDRIWLDVAPVGTSLPVWAQELDGKVARTELAAARSEAAAVRSEAAAAATNPADLVPREVGGRLVFIYREDLE